MTTVTTTRESSPASAERARLLGLVTPAGAVMGSVLALAFLALGYRWFLRQHQFCLNNMADWGHAYFIPLISLYILYQKRDELAATPTRTFWPALPPLLLGVFSYWFLVVGVQIPGVHMYQGVALVLTLMATVLLVAGPAVFRIAFLPMAFLVFGITISEKVMLYVTFPLQTAAAAGADVMLQVIGALAGFTAERAGNTLTVISANGVEHTLNVAEACSGMRMVIAFLALGAAVALIGTRHWWQRVALVLLTVPVAVLLNVVRVAVLGLLSLVNPDLATGEAHTLIGTLLLVPGLGLFLLVVWVLKRIVDEPAEAAT